MTYDEKVKNLENLPWQALFNVAINKSIDETEVKGKDKSFIISKLLSEDKLDDKEIEDLVNDYIYGDRVTFTLWAFDTEVCDDTFNCIRQLEGLYEPFVEATGFRNLTILSVNDYTNRFELLYVYSKEYSFINESGHNDSVWELHRGCIWIGKQGNYVASISKHDKMARLMIAFLASQLKKSIKQIKPPKAAIERCIKYKAISRIVLQSTAGEKTIISKSDGFTQDQMDEADRLREGRFDTSGSYIAEISDNTSATVKYNVNKGSIGIYKHLSANELFDWSDNAINIILEEIERLKGRPATEIFRELGIELTWTIVPKCDYPSLNWFLTEAIASLEEDEERVSTIPSEYMRLLLDSTLFYKVPRVYCDECDSYEIPICQNCGKPVTMDGSGNLKCDCGAPLKFVCGEGHSATTISYWYIPTGKLLRAIEKNIHKIYKDSSLGTFCIMGSELHIVSSVQEDDTVEIPFENVVEFIPKSNGSARITSYAIRMNEKCGGTCSYAKINKCVGDKSMACLPKVFYTILPGYRPQPHMNGEYGDVAGQVVVGSKHYELKGIIKKNTMNTATGKGKADKELIEEPLKSTSKEGEEIIRQFVEQGLTDTRATIIAVIAPQYFDANLKGTLRYLARVGHKKVLFVELDDVCSLLAMNDTISVS